MSETLNTRKAAAFLGKKPATLRSWRLRGLGPPYKIQDHSGIAIYDRADLVAFKAKEEADGKAS
jgi:hypothetical protein